MATSSPPDCERCGHSPDWHRLDSEQNVGPNDPAALFRCLGYDADSDTSGYPPGGRACDCPDFVPSIPKAIP